MWGWWSIQYLSCIQHGGSYWQKCATTFLKVLAAPAAIELWFEHYPPESVQKCRPHLFICICMQYANVYNMKNLPRHESQFEPCYAKFTSFPPKSQFHPQTTKTTHQGTFNFHIVQLSSLSITCYGIHNLHFGANGSSHLGTIYHGTTSCVGQLQSICGLAVSCPQKSHSSPNEKRESPNK